MLTPVTVRCHRTGQVCEVLVGPTVAEAKNRPKKKQVVGRKGKAEQNISNAKAAFVAPRRRITPASRGRNHLVLSYFQEPS